MRRNILHFAVFAAGLAIVCWVGFGYVGSNPLGALVALLIGVGYVAGAIELFRYRQATATLDAATAELSSTPASLGGWLDHLHPSLRHAVRLRVEGERSALPSPSLTPYLVGLLVLLGMLGTLLGMMATLRGTGIALESATDLQSIRGSLAAPVKGLGFAFGTSIAGVATSAMLGLLSALARRERTHAVQQLDLKAATTLRVFSQAHQRDESFRLLQQQTELMPTLIDRLQSMMGAIEQQNAATGQRHADSQDAFHTKAEATFARLASSVEQSLKDGVADSARAASAALQPIFETTMAGIARETATLHASINTAVERQLEGLSSGFATTSAHVTTAWNDAIASQRAANDAQADALRTAHETQATDLRATLDAFTIGFDKRAGEMVDNVATRLDASASTTNDAWTRALESQASGNDALAARHEQAMATASETFAAQAAALVDTMHKAQADLQATLAARDTDRLTAWTDALNAMSTSLAAQWKQSGDDAAALWKQAGDDAVAQWKQAGEDTVAQQAAIRESLAQAANDITTQSQAHASATIAEISRLVDAASEAPRAAADVVAELRQKLSDSMVRDTATLEERSRLLETVETLLSAVNHASTEQRAAIDGLVSTSAELLDRVGSRFIAHVEGETGKLEGVAERITGSADNVASLGEAFGGAVQAFGQSNDALLARLQEIGEALDRSLARSDEQLAYYVAQAREVVDLSVLSQKQILEDMQQLAAKKGGAKA